MLFSGRARVSAANHTTSTQAPMVQDNDIRILREEQGENVDMSDVENVCEMECPSADEICSDLQELLNQVSHDNKMEWDGKIEKVTQEGRFQSLLLLPF